MRLTTLVPLLLLVSACSDPVSLSPCTVACYDGPEGTRGVGACRTGYTECDSDNVVIGCANQVTPTDETCDLVDNDCDGVVDNIDSRGPCGTALGACEQGELHCVGGAWKCVGAVGPQPETFDCLDNDCDGVVDNDAPRVWCYTGDDPNQATVGACRPGYISCTDNCIDQVVPRPFDICGNNLDDDCDGQTDEEDLVEQSPVAIVMVVDRSGSMDRPLRNVRAALTGFANNHRGDPLYNLYLLDLPGNAPADGTTQPNPVCHGSWPLAPCPVKTFLEAVAQLDTSHGGLEPSYDAIFDLVVGTTSIAWPDGARRYVVLFGDEPGQTAPGRTLTEPQVASAIAASDFTFYGYVDTWNHGDDYDDIASVSNGVLVDLYESRSDLEVSFESIVTPYCD